MSLENQLERIACALEALVELKQTPGQSPQVESERSETKSTPATTLVSPENLELNSKLEELSRAEMLEMAKARGIKNAHRMKNDALKDTLLDVVSAERDGEEPINPPEKHVDEVVAPKPKPAPKKNVPLNETKEYAECREAIRALANRGGAPAALAVLQNFGASKLRELPNVEIVIKATALADKELKLLEGLE